mgnify:FL=1
MRSIYQPYCFLIPEHKTENAEKRLKMLEETTDGFQLAEYDLMNRGPGEFFGEKQSGSMNFRFADLRSDNDVLLRANEDSEEIINSKEFFEHAEFAALYNHAVANYNKKQEEID